MAAEEVGEFGRPRRRRGSVGKPGKVSFGGCRDSEVAKTGVTGSAEERGERYIEQNFAGARSSRSAPNQRGVSPYPAGAAGTPVPTRRGSSSDTATNWRRDAGLEGVGHQRLLTRLLAGN